MKLHNTAEAPRGLELTHQPKGQKHLSKIVLRVDGTATPDGQTSIEVPAEYVPAAQARIATLRKVGLELTD